jgi:hypothetical protein
MSLIRSFTPPSSPEVPFAANISDAGVDLAILPERFNETASPDEGLLSAAVIRPDAIRASKVPAANIIAALFGVAKGWRKADVSGRI